MENSRIRRSEVMGFADVAVGTTAGGDESVVDSSPQPAGSLRMLEDTPPLYLCLSDPTPWGARCFYLSPGEN